MISTLYAAYEYEISFAIGLISIAYFCAKQINLPYRDAVTEKFPFAEGKGPQAYAGRTLIFEAICYFFLLIGLAYSALCFSEALYKFIFVDNKSGGSNPAPAFDPKSGTWPLTVAVLIVGLSSDFPVLKDVEQILRGVARRAAGIPSNFLKALQNINQFDFTKLFNQSDEATDFYEEVTILHFYYTVCGASRTDAAENREQLYRALMLSRWIFSDAADSHWTIEGLTKARSASIALTEQVNQDFENFRASVKKIKDTEFYGKLKNCVKLLGEEAKCDEKVFFNYSMHESDDIKEIWSLYGNEVTPIFDEALETSKKLVEHNNNLENSFAVLFLNEGPSSAIRDGALSRLFDHVASFRSQVQRNLIVWIIFWAVVITLISGSAYYFIREILRPDQVEASFSIFQTAVRIGSQHSLGVFVIVSFSLLGANLFDKATYGLRISSKSSDGVAPILFYICLFSVSAISAFLAQVVLWIVTNIEPKTDWGIFIKDAKSFLPDIILWTLFGPVLSISIFVWLKRIEGGVKNKGDEAEYYFHNRSSIRIQCEALGTAFACALVVLLGFLLLHDDIGRRIIEPYGDGNKVLKLSLSFLVPWLVLVLVSGQLRRVSKLRAAF